MPERLIDPVLNKHTHINSLPYLWTREGWSYVGRMELYKEDEAM